VNQKSTKHVLSRLQSLFVLFSSAHSHGKYLQQVSLKSVHRDISSRITENGRTTGRTTGKSKASVAYCLRRHKNEWEIALHWSN